MVKESSEPALPGGGGAIPLGQATISQWYCKAPTGSFGGNTLLMTHDFESACKIFPVATFHKELNGIVALPTANSVS